MRNHFIPTFVCNPVNIIFIFSGTIKLSKGKKIKTGLQNHAKLSVLGYVKDRFSSVVSSKNLLFPLLLLVFFGTYFIYYEILPYSEVGTFQSCCT